MGITNMAATIPGFLVPMVVGSLTRDKVNYKCAELFQLKKFFVINISLFFINGSIKYKNKQIITAWYTTLAYGFLYYCWFTRFGILDILHFWIWRRTVMEL